MKVLFVCSGNNKNFEIIPFIKEQGESVKRQGIQVDYFPIKGKGLLGYLKASLRLKKYLKTRHYDLIHAHYTLSGWTALIGGGKIPVVLSLMGDDALGTYKGVNNISLKSKYQVLLTFFIQPFVKAIISKSQNIEKKVYLKKKSYIVPNGVDTQKFKPFWSNRTAIESKSGKKILFLGSKDRVTKNYTLAQSAVSLLDQNVEFINPYPVAHHEVPNYLNDADVLVFPSLMEGSPNVVKEAMACSCPIVATDVGDIKWVVGNTDGCYISSFDIKEFAEKIKLALKYSEMKGRTNGAERIRELGLDADSVANKLIHIYSKVLKRQINKPINNVRIAAEVKTSTEALKPQ
ncbi:MAG TPA: glycosyltransferase family 4 protein [Flavisolibacter sp.]|nr:glycosyltransferase family 4 protein [Flavisolibacter sp.]